MDLLRPKLDVTQRFEYSHVLTERWATEDPVGELWENREGENLRNMCIFLEIILLPVTKANRTRAGLFSTSLKFPIDTFMLTLSDFYFFLI